MAERFTLDNGLTVVHEPQHEARVAAFQIWVNVGSADETPDEVGLAHLHEHMLFKGTARRGLGEIARSIEAHGGEVNAWTSYDNTVYHVVIASQFAQLGLEVLADAVRESAFDAGELSREIEVVCEEIKRSLDMPSRRASKDLFATAFPTHPYGRPVIGFEPNVRAHTRAGVLAFYKKHYTPKNLVLAAAGDFTPAQLQSWAQALLGGDWGRPYAGRPARVVEPPATGRRFLLKSDAVKEAWLNLAFPAPGAAHADAPVLDVLAMVAGQGDASRLSLSVKRQRALVNGISAWAYTPRDAGLFSVGFTAPPANARAALMESARVLRALCEQEVEGAELETVQGLFEAEATYQRETVQGLSRKLGHYEAALGGVEREAEYYAAVAKVTPSSLRAVAQRYLQLSKAVVTGLLPEGSALDAAAAGAALDEAESAPLEKAAPRRAVLAVPRKGNPVHGAATPELVVETFANGATVIVREERNVPLFSMRAVFPGGLRAETPEVNGISSLWAKSLTRGTATLSAEAVSNLVDALCGGLGASPGRSMLSMRSEFLSRSFERGFELFAQTLIEPAFLEEEVAREKKLQLEDVRARDDRPSTMAFEQLAKLLYRAHPYRMSLVGERNSLEGLDGAQLRSFHQRLVNPANLTLAVVGDVEAKQVLALARQAFGAPGVKAPALVVPVEPAWEGPREGRITLQKAQTHLVLGFPGASVHDAWRRDLEVLVTVLSGQSGRLFMELRDKRSMAYSVSAMSIEGVDPGYFAVYIGTSPEKVNDALAGMKVELQKLLDAPITAQELERAQANLIGSHEIGLQRNGARAGLMAVDQSFGLGADRYHGYAEEISRVTAESVRAVAARVIDFERSALSVVGP